MLKGICRGGLFDAKINSRASNQAIKHSIIQTYTQAFKQSNIVQAMNLNAKQFSNPRECH
jgi:hypothetical protein